jgi:hypothetical protein
MGLSPKQMEDAIIQNLKSKTGKTLQEWLATLKESKILDKKEAIGFLKTEKGLGHFQAQTVYKHFNNQGQ